MDQQRVLPADRKWGSAYLTREFFFRIGETMPEQVRHGGTQPKTVFFIHTFARLCWWLLMRDPGHLCWQAHSTCSAATACMDATGAVGEDQPSKTFTLSCATTGARLHIRKRHAINARHAQCDRRGY